MLKLENAFPGERICLSDEEMNILKGIEQAYEVNFIDGVNEAKDIQHKYKTFCITVPFSKIKNDVNLIKQHFVLFDYKLHRITNWYHQINERIYRELGESNGTLMLMLLATTSNSTEIIKNTVVALKIYEDLAYDISKNRKLLVDFIRIYAKDIRGGEAKFTHTNLIPKEYRQLRIFNYLKEGMVFAGKAYLKNLFNIINLLIESNFNLTRKGAIDWLLANYDFINQELGQNTVRGFKIFNFTLNLLDPDFNVIGKENMYKFLTIDRHMIRFVVPEARDPKYFNQILQKVFSNEKGLYFTLIEYVNEIRDKLAPVKSLTNSQLQAMAWYVAIKKYSKEKIDFKSYNDVLDRLDKLLDNEENELAKESSSIDNLISKIKGRHNTVKSVKYFRGDPNQISMF